MIPTPLTAAYFDNAMARAKDYIDRNDLLGLCDFLKGAGFTLPDSLAKWRSETHARLDDEAHERYCEMQDYGHEPESEDDDTEDHSEDTEEEVDHAV